VQIIPTLRAGGFIHSIFVSGKTGDSASQTRARNAEDIITAMRSGQLFHFHARQVARAVNHSAPVLVVTRVGP
jgi:dihydrodipicolinate synthase/N-acetylneuraminate lyase